MEKFQPTLTYNAGADQPVLKSFAYFVNSYARLKSPVYVALMKAALDDADIQAIAEECRAGQPIGNMLLAITHYLALRNPEEPLAAYFPSCTDHPRPLDQDIGVAFSQFCRKYGDDIRQLIRVKTLQLTSADRAATLLLGLQPVMAETAGAIDLIELGCSAGLLLNFDRYAYDLGESGIAGDRGSPLTLPITLRLTAPLEKIDMPRIGERVGLDLEPVDVRDPAQRDWVQAMIPPDHIAEQRRLREALSLRAASDIRMLQGDALALLESESQRMSNTLCIFHSWCLYQWPQHATVALEGKIKAISASRVVHRLSIEKDPATADCAEVVHMVYAEGDLVKSARIARADGFGRWIEWFGDRA